MILQGKSRSKFEVSFLGYEYPNARNDRWDMNLLHIKVFLRDTHGQESENMTFLHTKELIDFEKWIELIDQHKQAKKSFDFYCGKFWFDLLERTEEYAIFQITINFSSGKGSKLPKERKDPYSWFSQIYFTVSSHQLHKVYVSLQEEQNRFPVREKN